MGIDNFGGKQNNIRPLKEVMAENKAARNKVMEPYLLVGLAEYEFGADSPYDDSRQNFPGAGWKFHLNVAPWDVRQVSRILKELNMHHKYLSAGSPDEGSVFTIYTGSKRTTEIAVRLVFRKAGHLLANPPQGIGEALFAPGIMGRFEGEAKCYHRKVSKDGITMHREVYSGGEISSLQVEISRRRLQAQYGDYFGGGIEYYDPKKDLSVLV